VARRPSFELSLAALSLIALGIRVAYVVVQPATDPGATGALLDGAYYVRWGQAMAAGTTAHAGAYYLAPLYAWLLGGFFTIFGDAIAWLYLLQHVTLVVTAVLLALCARELADDATGLAAAVLTLLYHPALFFASRPLGEPVALLLLVLALWLLMRPSPVALFGSGIAVALSALARPNLLLVIAVWGFIGVAWALRGPAIGDELDTARRRRAGFALALAGVAIVLLPVVVRNWRASGHLVPISANSGLTLFHGNGPGAMGIGVQPPGFSGRVATQRQEATRLASLQSGRPLDDVEADRWWGRQAVKARLADPAGSLLLMLRRTGLLLSTRELDLDYAPSIDGNPWRRATPLPFALLLALSAGGLYLAGPRRSGGWIVWGAIVACAATPLLFYVSSRYRLPVAVLLAIPAAVGLMELIRSRGRRRLSALAVVGCVIVVSATVPAGEVARTTQAVALANRADSWRQAGDLARAEQDLQRALEIDPESAPVQFELGLLFVATGRSAEAGRHYREALRIRPDLAEAAQNLSSLLIAEGRASESVPILLRALKIRPEHDGCWKNLIVAHYAMGDPATARSIAERARRSGVRLDPGWLAGLEGGS